MLSWASKQELDGPSERHASFPDGEAWLDFEPLSVGSGFPESQMPLSQWGGWLRKKKTSTAVGPFSLSSSVLEHRGTDVSPVLVNANGEFQTNGLVRDWELSPPVHTHRGGLGRENKGWVSQHHSLSCLAGAVWDSRCLLTAMRKDNRKLKINSHLGLSYC